MAYVERNFPYPRLGLMFFFNVHDAVGPGAPNRANDVWLVQTMLADILNDPTFGFPETIQATRAFDDVTARAIREFQKAWRRRVRLSLGQRDGAIDGRVSSAQNIGYQRGPDIWAYTIVAMNVEWKLYQPDRFQQLAEANQLT